MMGFERSYLVQMLLELEKEEEYLRVLPGEKIRLTTRGVRYCDDPDSLSVLLSKKLRCSGTDNNVELDSHH